MDRVSVIAFGIFACPAFAIFAVPVPVYSPASTPSSFNAPMPFFTPVSTPELSNPQGFTPPIPTSSTLPRNTVEARSLASPEPQPTPSARTPVTRISTKAYGPDYHWIPLGKNTYVVDKDEIHLPLSNRRHLAPQKPFQVETAIVTSEPVAPTAMPLIPPPLEEPDSTPTTNMPPKEGADIATKNPTAHLRVEEADDKLNHVKQPHLAAKTAVLDMEIQLQNAEEQFKKAQEAGREARIANSTQQIIESSYAEEIAKGNAEHAKNDLEIAQQQASLAKNLLDEGKKATETETKTFVDQIEQAVKETSNQVTIAEKEVEEANKQAQKAQIELDALRVAAKEVEKANKRANQAMQVLGGSTLEDLEEVRMKVTVAMRTTIKSKVKLQEVKTRAEARQRDLQDARVLAKRSLAWHSAAQITSKTPPEAYSGNSKGTGFRITSSSFENNGCIPETFCCNASGTNYFADYHNKVSPSLAWQNPPANTTSFVLLVDSEVGGWVHWLLKDIPLDTRSIVEGASSSGPAPYLPCGSKEMPNTWGDNSFGAFCTIKEVPSTKYTIWLYAMTTKHTVVQLPQPLTSIALHQQLRQGATGLAKWSGAHARPSWSLMSSVQRHKINTCKCTH